MGSVMEKICKRCGGKFEIFERDLEFYKKISVPLPAFCPLCRMQRRMRFRNERHLYPAKCGLCGKFIITSYAPGVSFPIYCNDCWYGDKWDPLKYGLEFDFDRPFFEQFKELLDVVPHPAATVHDNVNSEYTHCTSFLKNCYLLAGANHDEDSYYGIFINHCKDACDCFIVDNSELLYECIECDHCYNLNFSKNCRSCSDGSFLYNCRSCQKCFGCVNLLNKSFCIFNKQFSKDEYEKEIKKYELNSPAKIAEMDKFFQKHLVKFPQKYMIGDYNENATGDFVMHCKNAFNCFDVTHCEDCSYCMWLHNARDCYDIYAYGFSSEKCYECVETGNNSYENLFCVTSMGSSDVMYSMLAMNSQHIFGCVSMKRNKYCIFNKQYDEEEFFKLRERIVEHMKKTPTELGVSTIGQAKTGARLASAKADQAPTASEYGEFFPENLTPYSYEDSLAGDYFPKWI